jgi:hypothetical protein
MNAITEFERFGELTTSSKCLHVKRCEGHHCVEIKPKQIKDDKRPLNQIIWLKNKIIQGEFPGLCCDALYDPDTCYKLRVCIRQPRYHEVLSDEIDKHVEQMKEM